MKSKRHFKYKIHLKGKGEKRALFREQVDVHSHILEYFSQTIYVTTECFDKEQVDCHTPLDTYQK